jgi:hypothetical protein
MNGVKREGYCYMSILWKSKKQQKKSYVKKSYEYTNALIVHFTNGEKHRVWHENYDVRLGTIYPWKYFYKWFYSRPNSEYYTFKSISKNAKVQTTVRRKDIRMIQVILEKHEKNNDS